VTEEKSVIDFLMDGAPVDGLLNDNHLGTARSRARCRCGRRPHHQNKHNRRRSWPKRCSGPPDRSARSPLTHIAAASREGFSTKFVDSRRRSNGSNAQIAACWAFRFWTSVVPCWAVAQPLLTSGWSRPQVTPNLIKPSKPDSMLLAFCWWRRSSALSRSCSIAASRMIGSDQTSSSRSR
jgi:hypothetical protein